MGAFDAVGLDLSQEDVVAPLDEVQMMVAASVAHGTHIEALAWALGRASEWNQGAILEVGSGWNSTPIVHGFAEATGRKVYTVECVVEWGARLSGMYPDDWHRFNVLPPGRIEVPTDDIAVALVDGQNEDRVAWLGALRGLAPGAIVVVHDTEPTRPEYPGLPEVLDAWDNRRDWRRLYPWTTAVWDD